MDVFPAAVSLVIRALVVSARWAARQRELALQQAAANASASRVAELEARVAMLEDALELRDAHISVLEARLGKQRPRRPYPLTQRIRIIWLMEYFRIPKRRLSKALGVSRSSVQRWLKALQDGDLGKRQCPREPVNKTPQQIAALIWEIFRHNPMWGRHRIAMTTWGLGVFVAASTVRDILRRPRPRRASAHVGIVKQPEVRPRQIVARYPNHVWSVDRTRVWRWRIWPTWVLVAVDHYSRMVTTVCALEGPNAGWVTDALESAFVRHGVPKYIITDQEGIFTGGAFGELLSKWGPKQRLGAVGKHGSIAVTERAILTLKHEWLRRVPLIGGLEHLGRLLSDFTEYYNGWRGHMTLGGAVPCAIYAGCAWQKPDRTSKTVSGTIERRFFPESHVTAFRLSDWPGRTDSADGRAQWGDLLHTQSIPRTPAVPQVAYRHAEGYHS